MPSGTAALRVGDVPVELVRKRIRHLHLYVKPPDGHVLVTAPEETSEENVLLFVRENFSWVLRQREGMRRQVRQTPREYVSGETHYLWGRQLFLVLERGAARFGIELAGNRLLLRAPERSTPKSRGEHVAEWYRRLLAEAIAVELPAIERTTGLRCARWQIRDMARQWGSCKPDTATIQINLQLAQKEKAALRYVLLHELCHLKVRGHGKEFTALMDRFMPDWREVRKRLNDAPVAHTEDRAPAKQPPEDGKRETPSDMPLADSRLATENRDPA